VYWDFANIFRGLTYTIAQNFGEISFTCFAYSYVFDHLNISLSDVVSCFTSRVSISGQHLFRTFYTIAGAYIESSIGGENWLPDQR